MRIATLLMVIIVIPMSIMCVGTDAICQYWKSQADVSPSSHLGWFAAFILCAVVLTILEAIVATKVIRRSAGDYVRAVVDGNQN